MKLTGYAVLWNVEAIELDGYTEVIRPQAFKRSLGKKLLYALVEHQGLPIACESDGTLLVGEDDAGLWYEMTIDDSIDVSQYSGVSVRFNPFAHQQHGRVHEVVTGELIEISLVSNPCYDCTTITLVLDEKAL